MRKLTHQELALRQQSSSEEKIPAVAVLNNIRSLYNVGSIFRTAEGAGFEEIVLCGITGIPPASKISKTALGAEKKVRWQYFQHAAQALRNYKDRGYQIILLEQTLSSIPYQNFDPQAPACLVVGNETSGVHEELVQVADASIEIEMAGLKNSLNVTVAFGIVAYDLRNKLLAERRAHGA